MTYQKLTIVGNLGKDPETRYLDSGDTVTQLSIATNRTYTKDGQKMKEVTWFRVSVWGKQAESVTKYLKKGSRCLVEGELQPDKETGSPRVFTRNDGTSGASYEVRAGRVLFLTKAESEEVAVDGNEDFPF